MVDQLNRIIQGDCIQELAKLPEGCVDLVFADPPFNIGYDYDVYDDKRSCEDYLDWSREWISGVKRVLRTWGAFWLAIGDEYAAELKVLATREVGFVCRSWVVWYYTFGVHCTHKFTRSHTHLFYFLKPKEKVPGRGRGGGRSKSAESAGRAGNIKSGHRGVPAVIPESLTFNADDIRVPSARQLVYGDKRANPKGRVPDDTWILRPTPHRSWILRPQDLPKGFEADSDTWYYPRVCGTFKQREGFHGCQMPEQLLGRIIKACSKECDVVLDPFTGSGTTLAVAKKLGRRYLGIELSEQYVNESQIRLRQAETGQPLDGFEDPLTSVPDTKNGTVRTADGRRIRKQSFHQMRKPDTADPGE